MLQIPAPAIAIEGDEIPRLAGSPIERALSRILRPTLCAVARAVDPKFDVERIDIAHGYSGQHLQLQAVISSPRQQELVETHTTDDDLSRRYIDLLCRSAACVVQALSLRAKGIPITFVYERDSVFNWLASEGHIQVRGPLVVQQVVRGLIAFVRRIVANHEGEVNLLIAGEPYRFMYSKPSEEMTITETESLTGIISGVDDLSSTLALKHSTRTPRQVTHMSLPSALRDECIEHLLHRRVVQIEAEISRRNKKQVSGIVNSVQLVDPVADLLGAAIGQPTHTPTLPQRDRKKIRRKR